jgi:hypothetical protein
MNSSAADLELLARRKVDRVFLCRDSCTPTVSSFRC